MSFRFSGHETFPCRYAWLPKAFRAIRANGRAFADEEAAIVELGVGKNMVRAIKFWVQATGVAVPIAPTNSSYEVTNFGRAIFEEEGFDPYLEDVRTLWLIHWKLSSHIDDPLFAWYFLLNRWRHPEISRTEVLRAFRQEADKLDRKLSNVTLEQHFDTFLHTYVPTRSPKGELREDNLDSPLVELELIVKVGERILDKTGKREAVYAFRREPKSEITPELFLYCLHDFWSKQYPNERSLTFRDIAIVSGSPGQILKLPESDIRDRLEHIEEDSNGIYQYRESAAMQQITRRDDDDVVIQNYLSGVYHPEVLHD